jgi:hypothetical protein
MIIISKVSESKDIIYIRINAIYYERIHDFDQQVNVIDRGCVIAKFCVGLLIFYI